MSLLAACSPAPQTEVVLVLHTTLSVPDELDAIRIEIQGENTPAESSEVLLGNDSSQLPVTLGIVAEDRDAEPTVRIGLRGFRDGLDVIRRNGQVSLVRGERRMLSVGLFAECLRCGDSCPSEACADFSFEGRDLPLYDGTLPGLTNPFDGDCLGANCGGVLRPIKQLATGGSATCLVDPDDRFLCFDAERQGAPFFDLPAPQRFALGDAFGCLVNTEGITQCWGDGAHGQLGAGDTASSAEPADVRLADAAFEGVEQLALGSRHACAIRGGELYCWGDNRSRQINGRALVVTGIPSNYPEPTQVVLPGQVSEVACGDTHTCALTTDGSLYCWGDPSSAQTGHGASLPLNPGQPHKVELGDEGPPAIEALALGAKHTCVRSGSQIFCMGNNQEKAAGVVNPQSRVDMLTQLTEVSGTLLAAGLNHNCVASGASLQCWGRGQESQIGQTLTATANPTTTTFASDITHVVAAANHSCVALEDGSVECFGSNEREAFGTSSGPGGADPVRIREAD